MPEVTSAPTSAAAELVCREPADGAEAPDLQQRQAGGHAQQAISGRAQSRVVEAEPLLQPGIARSGRRADVHRAVQPAEQHDGDQAGDDDTAEVTTKKCSSRA